MVSLSTLEALTLPSPDFGSLVPSLFCSWAVWADKDDAGQWFVPEGFDRSPSLAFPELSEELAAVLYTDCIFLGTTPGESALTRYPGQDDWLPFHARGPLPG